MIVRRRKTNDFEKLEFVFRCRRDTICVFRFSATAEDVANARVKHFAAVEGGHVAAPETVVQLIV